MAGILFRKLFFACKFSSDVVKKVVYLLHNFSGCATFRDIKDSERRTESINRTVERIKESAQ